MGVTGVQTCALPIFSPLDDAGGWFLVEKHVAPACGAGAANLTYSVWSPAHTMYKPRPLFVGHASIVADSGDTVALSVDAGRFDIRYRAADRPGPPDVTASYTLDAHGAVPI